MKPLDDVEILEFVVWETRPEIEAFRVGWLARRILRVPPGEVPEAKALGLYRDDQNARVAWERGWMACDAVRKVLLS